MRPDVHPVGSVGRGTGGDGGAGGAANMSTDAQTFPESVRMINSLCNEVGMLHELLGELGLRLNVVMREPTPSKHADLTEALANTPMGRNIQDETIKVRQANDAIRDIFSRLEI